MNKLEVAMFLIEEARDKQEKLKQYQQEREVAKEKDSKVMKERENRGETNIYYFQHQRELDEKWGFKIPKKSEINDNLKIARRLLRESYNE